MAEEVYAYIKAYVYPVLSKISAWFAFLVILIMILFTIYDWRLVDRVTLRLQTGIACYDLWLHSLPLWARPFHKKPSPMCNFVAWMYVFFPTIYVFFNVCIGINLQLVFLKNIAITRKTELGYWVGTIFMGLLFSIPPLAMGKLGWTEKNGCFTTDDQYYGRMFDFFVIVLPLMLALIYLAVIVILVFIKLRKGALIIKGSNTGLGSASSLEAARVIKQLGYRILLYPIVMLITHSGMVVSQTNFDFTLSDPTYNDSLESWSNIGGGILGMLNFIAFCCDPTFQNAVKTVYHRIRGISPSKPNKENIELSCPNYLNTSQNSFDEENQFDLEKKELSDIIRGL